MNNDPNSWALVADFLIAAGYTAGDMKKETWMPGVTHYTKMFWKQHRNPKFVCKSNGSLQLCVTLTEINDLGRRYFSARVDIRAADMAGDWLDFQYYALDLGDFRERFISIIGRLVAAWNAANSFK